MNGVRGDENKVITMYEEGIFSDQLNCRISEKRVALDGTIRLLTTSLSKISDVGITLKKNNFNFKVSIVIF